MAPVAATAGYAWRAAGAVTWLPQPFFRVTQESMGHGSRQLRQLRPARLGSPTSSPRGTGRASGLRSRSTSIAIPSWPTTSASCSRPWSRSSRSRKTTGSGRAGSRAAGAGAASSSAISASSAKSARAAWASSTRPSRSRWAATSRSRCCPGTCCWTPGPSGGSSARRRRRPGCTTPISSPSSASASRRACRTTSCSSSRAWAWMRCWRS